MTLYHPSLPETPLEDLVAGGISKVQLAYEAPFLKNTSQPSEAHRTVLHEGLVELEFVQEGLDVRPTIGKFRDNPHIEFPREPIMQETLTSIAISRIATTEEKLELTETWIQATSEGKGRVYPLNWIARHMASSILEELALRPTPNAIAHDINKIVHAIDNTFLSARVFRSLRTVHDTLWRPHGK